MRTKPFALAVLFLSVAAARADVVVLTGGDRITGRVVGKVTRRVRLQTPYGTLVIPRDKVERILRDDGSEELVNAKPAPTPPPPPPPVALVVAVRGHAFWQAWDPKAAPADPSLRLEVLLDDHVVVDYIDANLDPEDLPKAVVNTFIFAPARLFVQSATKVLARPPELASGEILLALELPGELAGRRRLHLAYQVNEGSSAEPRWRDVVEAATDVVLDRSAPAHVRLEQDRGLMQFAKHAMRNVETFHAVAQAEPSAP
jgi:hypothetical protein